MKQVFQDNLENIVGAASNYTLDEIASVLDYNIKRLTNRKRRIVTNKILNLRETENFINEHNYQRLVDFFGLRDFWEDKLKYGSLGMRQKALRKLDDLAIEVPGSVITSLTNNYNSFLRKRARSYYLYFSKNSPFKFFDEDFDRTFNNWDKVEIHNMLSRRADKNLPNLTQWIQNSKNTAFRCFLIDEIKHFNQTANCSYLVELIDNPEISIRKHAIDALGELNYSEAEKSFMLNYIIQPRIIQQAIIKAIHKLNTGKALPFLQKAYKNVHDMETRLVILDAIYHYGDAGKKLFLSMKKEADKDNLPAFEHVSNPLINTL